MRSALGVAWLGWAGLASAQSVAPREVRVEIVASADWTATGIELATGDALTIEAEPARTPAATVSPDGIAVRGERVASAAFEGLPVPDLPPAALIGRIGDGPIFLVGARYQAKAAVEGPLRLRWNLNLPPATGAPFYFPVMVRHEPVDAVDTKDPDKTGGNGEKVPDPVPPVDEPETANIAVETAVATAPAPPPRKAPARIEPAPAPARAAWGTPWLAAGAVVLLLAAAAGTTARRLRRVRTIKHTRAVLALSPRLDLGEGVCRGDDLPAQGPAASLRARLEPGATRCSEGGEDG